MILINKKIALLLLFLTFTLFGKEQFSIYANSRITAHVVDLKKDELNFYLKDYNGNVFKRFETLNSWLKKSNKKLIFAMNGGMYMENFMPLGLYVENGKRIRKTNRVKKAFGNFYMQPNGVFFITKKNNAYIKKT